MSYQTSTTLLYRLPYETKAQAEEAANQIAAALKGTIMSKADGWRWKDKEAQIAERKEAIEISKKSPTEAGRRVSEEHQEDLEKALEENAFDNINASYQWYPGNIDVKTGRITSLGLAYTDNGLEVSVTRMKPDQPEGR